MNVTIDEAFDAIKYDDIDTLTEYLNERKVEGPPPMEYANKLDTMFSCAIRWNRFDMMELLVANGANPVPNSTENWLYAKEKGDFDVWNYLYHGRALDKSKFQGNKNKEDC